MNPFSQVANSDTRTTEMTIPRVARFQRANRGENSPTKSVRISPLRSKIVEIISHAPVIVVPEIPKTQPSQIVVQSKLPVANAHINTSLCVSTRASASASASAATTPLKKFFYDVGYDGDVVCFYDIDRSVIGKFEAIIHKGSRNDAMRSGFFQKEIEKGTFIVINSSSFDRLIKTTTDFGWYAISKIAIREGFEPFVNFEPSRESNSNCIAITQDEDFKGKKLCIVETAKSDLYRKNWGKYFVFPLLETIVALNQEYAQMTLIQIAISINGCHTPEFLNKKFLIDYVFSHFLDRFKKFSLIEYTPMMKLYYSNFHLFFEHTTILKNPFPGVLSIKKMEDVVMIVISDLVGHPSQENCGNIPYNLKEGSIAADIINGYKCINYPFIFFQNSSRFSVVKKKTIFFHVIIFPRVNLDSISTVGEREDRGFSSSVSKEIPEGSMIGFTTDGEFVYKGELFEGITHREELIISSMYDAYIKGDLRNLNQDKCTTLFKEFKFESSQIKVRPDFIIKLRRLILSDV